jgi:hypothetical protein
MRQNGCKITLDPVPEDKFNYAKAEREQKAREAAAQKEYEKKCQKYQTSVSAEAARNMPSEPQVETPADATADPSPTQMQMETVSAMPVTQPAPDSATIVQTPTDAATESQIENTNDTGSLEPADKREIAPTVSFEPTVQMTIDVSALLATPEEATQSGVPSAIPVSAPVPVVHSPSKPKIVIKPKGGK